MHVGQSRWRQERAKRFWNTAIGPDCLMLLGGFLVMACGMCTVLRCLPVMFGSFLGHNALFLGFARLIGLHGFEPRLSALCCLASTDITPQEHAVPPTTRSPGAGEKAPGPRGIRKDHQLGRASFISLAAGPRCFCEKSHTGACANTEQATATGPDQRWLYATGPGIVARW